MMGADCTSAMLVQGIKRQAEKVYIILLTCVVTQALLVTLADNQSYDSFLLVVNKYCDRKALTPLVLSDDATTFVAAAGFLKETAKC